VKKTRILIVDDEFSIIKFLRAILEANGYEVLAAIDGTDALGIFEMELPDLVVLDRMMPKMDGFEVCRRIREWSQIPIIMLSARGDEDDKVKCLDLGADDYITKPFDKSELMARIRAVLRRISTALTVPTQTSFTSGDLKVSFAQRRVTVSGKEVKLTPTEYTLLQEFVLNAGKVLSHTHLLNKVWGTEYREEREYLHVFVRRLRVNLEPDPINPRYIITIRGVGYQFTDRA
jgi:two-component system KDP operon response regulator KdpE